MNGKMRCATVGAFLATAAFVLASAGRAQNNPCSAGKVVFKEALDSAAGIAPPVGTSQDQRNADLQKAQSAVNNQIAAPAGTSIVSHASFPSLLGMAVENGLVKSENNTTTVDLNLFAFLGLARPEVLFDQQKYEGFQGVRRVGGAVVFGGKGLKFDRDGDGKADEPLDAKQLNDIVSWELRYRLTSSSRDPRDYDNFHEIAAAVDASQGAFTKVDFDLISAISGEVVPDDFGCVDADAMKQALKRHDAKIKEVALAAKSTLDARDKVVDNIAHRLVWTLVAGGVERKAQFGPNSAKVGLRADWGKSSFDLNWMKTDAFPGSTTEPKTLSAGYNFSTKWFKGSFVPEGVDVSASATYEINRDVPDAKHDSVAKLHLAMEYPLGQGIKLPISVTWANHEDLLTGEKDIVAHFGFTVDVSKLVKPKESGTGAQ